MRPIDDPHLQVTRDRSQLGDRVIIEGKVYPPESVQGSGQSLEV